MIKRKSRFFLDRLLRRFVFEGVREGMPDNGTGDAPLSGIRAFNHPVWVKVKDQPRQRADFNVIMANEDYKTPKGLCATLQYLGESRDSPHHYERNGKVFMQQAVNARYLVSFLRNFEIEDLVFTSYDAAQSFINFVDSHHGIAWASNSVVDGKLTKVYVYQSILANGKVEFTNARFPVSLNPPDDQTWNPNLTGRLLDIPVPHKGDTEGYKEAKIRLYVSSNGKIESGFVLDPGSGYDMGQEVDLSNVEGLTDELVNPSENIFPQVTVVGTGFTIQRPLMIEEVDYPLTENTMEKRCMIEMDISFIEERLEPNPDRVVGRYEMFVNWN